jgi:anti-sigma B factor antagonist
MPISRSVLLDPIPSRTGPVFTMTAGEYSGIAVLSVSGELDQLTTGQFEQALATVLYDHARVLVIDLTETTFLGTCAISALLQVHRRLQNTRVHVVVVAHGPATARPLRLLGLSETIAIVDNLDIALNGTSLASHGPDSADRNDLSTAAAAHDGAVR